MFGHERIIPVIANTSPLYRAANIPGGFRLQTNVIKLSKRPQKSPLIKGKKGGGCF
uniref:Uncharacterized protein n=1 Tax=Kuenenia stuttgartiensis TaxID=174633 RepID=Q1PXW6_KUEST|nr:unknown protein [Candidatus Kuenenia stuttgartiensis]